MILEITLPEEMKLVLSLAPEEITSFEKWVQQSRSDDSYFSFNPMKNKNKIYRAGIRRSSVIAYVLKDENATS